VVFCTVADTADELNNKAIARIEKFSVAK
jgi:hypothetical protein